MRKIYNEAELLGMFIDKDEIRPALLKPFVGKDGRVYATDGRIGIRVNPECLEGRYEQDTKAPAIHTFFYLFTTDRQCTVDALAKALDNAPKAPKMLQFCEEGECHDCEGTGCVTWTYTADDGTEYDDDFDCPVCNGTGRIDITKTEDTNELAFFGTGVFEGFENHHFKWNLLETLLSALRNIGAKEFAIGIASEFGRGLIFQVNNDIQIVIASLFQVEGVHMTIETVKAGDKEGKDIFQCSIEAEKAGRDKAIEPGEPCDLIDELYLPVYRKLGREKFIELIKEHADLTPEKAFALAGIEKKSKRKSKQK